MAREAIELLNFLDESTRKRKRTAAEQHEAVSVAITSLEPHACIECAENDISLQNEITAGNGILGLRESNIQILKKTKRSILDDTLVERISPENGDSSADAVDNDQSSENSHASSKSSNGKRVLLSAGKLARTTAEKLWEGSLQLNSSVTVSAAAFFKSGEKMCDVKWPSIAEVKGKVRLGSFGRYIQDLSRSRNRGLMELEFLHVQMSDKNNELIKGYKRET